MGLPICSTRPDHDITVTFRSLADLLIFLKTLDLLEISLPIWDSFSSISTASAQSPPAGTPQRKTLSFDDPKTPTLSQVFE